MRYLAFHWFIFQNLFNRSARWKNHAFRENNTRTNIRFCCQFADAHGFPINHQIYEENSHYIRTALIANISMFQGIGGKSQKQYLEMTIRDGIENGKSMPEGLVKSSMLG